MQTVIAREIVNAKFGSFSQGTEERRNVEAAAADETMTLVKNADDTWSVKSPDGLEWLSVQPDGTLEGRSSAHDPGPWERWSRSGNVLTEWPKDGITRSLVEVVTP